MPCARYVPATAKDPRPERSPTRAATDARARRARAIARLYTHEHVGDRGFKSHELDALAGQAAREAMICRSTTESAIRAGWLDDADLDGELQNHRQALAGGHGRAPRDVVTIGQCLGQLEVRRARFVRDRTRVMSNDRCIQARRGARCIEESCAVVTVSIWRPMRVARNAFRAGSANLVVRLHRLERALARCVRCSSSHAALICGSISSYEGTRPGVTDVRRRDANPGPTRWAPATSLREPGRPRRQTSFRNRRDLLGSAICVLDSGT